MWRYRALRPNMTHVVLQRQENQAITARWPGAQAVVAMRATGGAEPLGLRHEAETFRRAGLRVLPRPDPLGTGRLALISRRSRMPPYRPRRKPVAPTHTPRPGPAAAGRQGSGAGR